MLNQCNFIDEASQKYLGGQTIRELASEYDVPISTMRSKLIKHGTSLRSRKESTQLAAQKGRMSHPGRRGPLSDEAKQNISKGRLIWSKENARGSRITQNGYIEYTKGEHKGRSEHVIKMENRLGRRLKVDECVHHIDGDRKNNCENNLALMTRSGHTRLHRREDALAGRNRSRNANGQFERG